VTTSIAWDGGSVSARWSDADTDTCLVLAHGAGGNLHQPQTERFAAMLAERGTAALRFNFAYAEARKRAPDRTPVLEAVYRAAAGHAASRYARVLVGGRSMGGRIGSHVVAQGFPAAGLVFLAYPLHAPGRTDKLRDAHLRTIEVPMLFLQGTRDTFARRDLLEEAVGAIPGATIHWIDGGDHSHKVRGRTPDDVLAELVATTAAWVRDRGR